MRILYVVNGFDPGGAEHGLLTLIQSGFFAGHDLKVLGFCQGRGALASRIAGELGAANVTIAAPETSLTLSGCLAGAKALWRTHREWRPDVVVLSLKQANVVGRLVTSFFPSARCVSFEHISRYRARKAEWVYRYLLWLLSFRVDEIWADCEQTHHETRRYFMPRKRLLHVVPVFKVDADAPRKDDYQRHAPLRIAAAGRLVERKNFLVAIDAIRAMRTRGLDAHLQIFGDGPDMAMLQRAIDRHGLHKSVQLSGYRRDWCGEALTHDLFVNLGDTEGFCIVVAEAMAAGLPVIATNVGGIREYGVDGQNIVTLDEVSTDALVSQVERLANDEDLRRRLGQRARRDMLETFSSDAMRARSRSVFSGTFSERDPESRQAAVVNLSPGDRLLRRR